MMSRSNKVIAGFVDLKWSGVGEIDQFSIAAKRRFFLTWKVTLRQNTLFFKDSQAKTTTNNLSQRIDNLSRSENIKIFSGENCRNFDSFLSKWVSEFSKPKFRNFDKNCIKKNLCYPALISFPMDDIGPKLCHLLLIIIWLLWILPCATVFNGLNGFAG